MSEKQNLSALFVNHASDVLGETQNGLSGSEIVRALSAYAIDFNVNIPHPTYPFEIPNKRTALSENLAMFFDDHNPPHFHARYAGEKAAIEIESLRIIEGYISPRALGLVIEWASQHREELFNNWELAKKNKMPNKIEPLR